MSFQGTLPTNTSSRSILQILPGVMLTAMMAALGTALHTLPVIGIFSPLILSILLGMAFYNVIGTPERAGAGITFALRWVLRFGIILIGLQVTVTDVAAIGGRGAAIIAASLVATMVFTKVVGRMLDVDPKLAELIGAGTSVCGASAIIATNTVTNGRDEDVGCALACVTIFGSLAMLLYPLAGAALQLAPFDYGLWSGASIHEIAQVMAACFQYGSDAEQSGTVAKLARIMMLAPLILTLGWFAIRRSTRSRLAIAGNNAVPIPWFVFGFLALVCVNGFIVIDPLVRSEIVVATNFLLAMALSALGLRTDFRKLMAAGPKPMLLGGVATLFISGFSLALILLAR